jgi:hypothetical protein
VQVHANARPGREPAAHRIDQDLIDSEVPGCLRTSAARRTSRRRPPRCSLS